MARVQSAVLKLTYLHEVRREIASNMAYMEDEESDSVKNLVASLDILITYYNKVVYGGVVK